MAGERANDRPGDERRAGLGGSTPPRHFPSHPQPGERSIGQLPPSGNHRAVGTRIAARRATMPTTADPNGKHGVEPQESDAYRVVVHWAPLVVPLFALLI